MLVAVKRPRIKVNVHGTGERMVAMVLKEKFPSAEIHEDDDRVPYRETSFAREMKHASTSGRRLWVYRDNAGLTMKELAEKSGISKSHLSEMENDKRAIGIRTARKLGTALRCNYLRFL